MNVMRWRFHALALYTIGLVACSDRPSVTELERPDNDAVSVLSGPVARLASGDPIAIPIGSPARIEFLGGARTSQRTLTFPLAVTPVDVDQLAQVAADWVAAQKAASRASLDPTLASAVQSIEGFLAARTPEDVQAALGPRRKRVTSTRSLRYQASGLFEHTASYKVDGRKVLRVVTHARPSDIRATIECVDDPSGLAIDPTQECGYDPSFEPEPVVADVAAMQYGLDETSMEIADIEALDSNSATKCQAERSAYFGSLLAFGWRAGETIWWAWNRHVPKTYTSLRDASVLYGATYALFLRYKQCIAGKGATDA